MERRAQAYHLKGLRAQVIEKPGGSHHRTNRVGR